MKKLVFKKDKDLKELEKFGFIQEHCDEIMEYLSCYCWSIFDNVFIEKALEISVCMDTREIDFYIDSEILEDEDKNKLIIKFYDLIKADLVEVVEDE